MHCLPKAESPAVAAGLSVSSLAPASAILALLAALTGTRLTLLLLARLLLAALLLLARILIGILIHLNLSCGLARCGTHHAPNPRQERASCLRRSFWNRTTPTRVPLSHNGTTEEIMGRYLLLWLLGIPLPILLLIWVFGGLH
jgi:hypothetical protein